MSEINSLTNSELLLSRKAATPADHEALVLGLLMESTGYDNCVKFDHYDTELNCFFLLKLFEMIKMLLDVFVKVL